MQNIQQISKEGNKNMLRQAFNRFLDDVILDHARRRDDHWSLFVSDIPKCEKKLFLAYLITIEDYEDYMVTEVRTDEAIKEYEPEMQYLINARIDDLYHEIKNELSQGGYDE